MERGQSLISPNPLKQYVFKMESEIGRSGRSFHHLLSHYLEMKATHPVLAQRIEDLEIAGADGISAEQLENTLELVRNLDALRKKVLHGMSSLADHPWYGIAHPDHKQEEFEPLLRSIRFVSIQLNKIWIEIQSIPLFLNALDVVSLEEIEKIFRWIMGSPNWSDMVAQPRVVPALAAFETRKALLDFMRDVKSVRLLRARLEMMMDSKFLDPSLIKNGLELLSEGKALVEKNHAGSVSSNTLKERILDSESELNHLEKIQHFFEKVSERTQLPLPKNLNEARKCYVAVKRVLEIPKKYITIKHEKFMDPDQRKRLEGWSKEAQEIIADRKKLELSFQLEAPVHPEELRKLANELASSGTLRTLSASYQAATQRYKTLLKVDHYSDSRKKKRETGEEMSDRLRMWASFLDRKTEFQNQEGIRTVLGCLFKGIDTDFSLAIQAHEWGEKLRADLVSKSSDDDVFGKALVDFLLRAPESHLNWIISWSVEEVSVEVEDYLNRPQETKSKQNDIDLATLVTRLKAEILECNRILKIAFDLNLPEDLSLGHFAELSMMVDEVLFLCRRMDSDSQLRHWLKSSYRGPDSDLNLIEQGFLFVQYIESAEIPDSLKNLFLSGHGPQRLLESRILITSAWTSYETFKELLQKLEVATYGQMKGAMTSSAPVLLGRVQQALKQPGLLRDWVDYLNCERELRHMGLSDLIEAYEKQSLSGWSLELVYECAFTASLLKHSIQSEKTAL